MVEILLGIACILFGIALFLIWQASGFWGYITFAFLFGGIGLAFYGFYKEYKE